MSKYALINTMPFETRLAIIKNGQLDEVFIERTQTRSLVGNVYLGTVIRVLPAMGSVFIDIGRERLAFLSEADLPLPSRPSAQDEVTAPDVTTLTLASAHAHSAKPSPKSSNKPSNKPQCAVLPRVGEKLMVQVTKDEFGTKGARVTTHIALPSRYLVYLPTSPQSFGVSTRIPQKSKRAQLKRLLEVCVEESGLAGGVIARSVCERAFHEQQEPDLTSLTKQLMTDMHYTEMLWQEICQKRTTASLSKGKFALLHAELPLPERALRDIIDDDVDEIWVDDAKVYQCMLTMSQTITPNLSSLIKQHADTAPLFTQFGRIDGVDVETQLQYALKRLCPLPSGGSVVIEHTEAMTTVDVNTGSFVGQGKSKGWRQADIVHQTNQEAVAVIARELRVRNIGGMIVLDFIDMNHEHHRQAVIEALTQELQRDPATTNITQISELGLIEMTRKRTRPSLSDVLCEPCPTCQGMGRVKSTETVAFDIIRSLMGRLAHVNTIKKPSMTIKASNAVVDYLQKTPDLLHLQEIARIDIHLQKDADYHQEQYVILVN